MELDITWVGPPIDDLQLLSKLPDDLTKLLKSVNGFIQFGGALHVGCVFWLTLPSKFATYQTVPLFLPT